MANVAAVVNTINRESFIQKADGNFNFYLES